MNTQDKSHLCELADRLTNKHAHKIGLAIADLLQLKRDREFKDRFPTCWGTKTPGGLARSILRLIAEVEELEGAGRVNQTAQHQPTETAP
jgi:hypothetical protein